MNQVQVMHSKVRHLAAGIIVEPAEPIEGSILIVRHLGRRTEPAFPIDIGRWVFVRWTTDASGPFVLNVESARNGDFANAAPADEFAKLAAERNRAPINSDLADPLVPLDGLDHAAPLGDTKRKRLFDIDIFTGFASVDGLRRMPMIRRGNDDRVHIFYLEQLSIIFELLWFAANFFGGKIKIRLVEIANRDDLGIGVFEESIEHLVASIAQANETKPDALVGSVNAKVAEGSACAGNSDGFGKLSASPCFHNAVLVCLC